MISPHQCRAARGLLDWSQTDLAKEAGVARATIAAFEAEKRTPIANNLSAIRTAFEFSKIEFHHDDTGVGVFIKLPQIEAALTKDGEVAIIFVENDAEPVALSIEDAEKEMLRSKVENDMNRARAIQRSLHAAKALKHGRSEV